MDSIPWRAARWAVVPLLSAACAGVAPLPADVARPDPLAADVAVPALTHSSSLQHYRSIDGDSRRPWREANDEVGRIGGWRAYAREAMPAQPAH